MSFQTHENKYILNYTNVNPLRQARIDLLCLLKVYLNKRVNPLRQAWCNFLNHYRWTYFVTLTFRDLPKTYTAINRAKQFLRYVERTQMFKVRYFICMELSKVGTPHFHALLGNLDGVRFAIFHKWWFARYGGTRFKVYDPKKKASYYLTKYAIKDSYQTGWYDIKGFEAKDQIALDIHDSHIKDINRDVYNVHKKVDKKYVSKICIKNMYQKYVSKIHKKSMAFELLLDKKIV